MVDFDAVIDRRGSDCTKWSEENNLAQFGRADVLPFWVADMDFESAPAIKEALAKRVEHGVFGYRTGNGHNTSYAAWVQRRFGWEVDPDWLVNLTGVVPGIRFAVQAFTQPGEKVLIQQPVYYPFEHSVTYNGCHLVSNDLVKRDGSWEVDFEDFERKVSDPMLTMFILCSPHNPVGRVWTEEELRRMADICIEHNVLIVSDEIHNDLIMPGYTHHMLASLDERYAQRVITLAAPSKTFNVAGLQLAYAIIPNEELRRRYAWQVRRLGMGTPNLFAAVTAEAAYTGAEKWLDDLLVYLGGNLAFVREYVTQYLPGVRLYEHQGTYLLWMDFGSYGLSDQELEEKIFREAGVALDAGTWFGSKSSSGHMRLNFACPRKTLEQGLERIAAVFHSAETNREE